MNSAVVILLASLLACCASRPTIQSVEKDMILPDGAQQTQLKPGQKFLMAVPIQTPLPSYAGWKIQAADTTICVEFVVADDGSVDSVHQIDNASNCEKVDSVASASYLPEVYSAVQSWTYFAAAMCEFKKSEDECDGPSANLTPLSIKLAYKFTFTQLNGRHHVSSGTID